MFNFNMNDLHAMQEQHQVIQQAYNICFSHIGCENCDFKNNNGELKINNSVVVCENIRSKNASEVH